jgi:curved DNA-binding protein CbpA
LDERSVPRPCAIKVDGLGLSSTDAFVLSRIDGTLTLEEVSEVTGVAVDKVIEIARRLAQLGAVETQRRLAKPEGRYATHVSQSKKSGTEERKIERKTEPRIEVRPEAKVTVKFTKPKLRDDSAILERIPKRTSRELRELSLETGDAFLLSFVDGASTVAELSEVVGEDALKIAGRVHALLDAGAVELLEKSPRRVSKRPTPPPSVAVRPTLEDARATIPAKPKQRSKAKPTTLPAPPTTPPAPVVIDETCELDDAMRARIDEALSAPDGQTHYRALGVAKTATAKEIQRAYFAIAAALHPDRHFGKKLGAYKQKLERVFRRAADAYETLRIAQKRAEYDQYLLLTSKSIQMERALAPVATEPPRKKSSKRIPVTRKTETKLAAVLESIDTTPRVQAMKIVNIAAPTVEQPLFEVEALDTFEVEQVVTINVDSLPPAAPKVEAPKVEAPKAAPVEAPKVEAPKAAPVEAKTSRVETTRRAPVQTKAQQILIAAQQALMAGDGVAAANHYRLALEYADDPGSRRYAESGLEEARKMLVDTQLKKARYEEKESRWSDAVVSYTKALDGRPDDPSICERLANALRHEGSDLQRAARLAELAVQRAPRRAAYRSTLGFIYAEAGSREKAIEQFERAIEIDSSDEASRHALEALKKRRR